MVEGRRIPTTGIFSEDLINIKLDESSINDETRKKVAEKLGKLKELMQVFLNKENILEGINIGELRSELSKEIEDTRGIGKDKLKAVVAECKVSIKEQASSMLKVIEDNMKLTEEAIKKAKEERRGIKADEKATTELALTKYEKDNVFTVFKRLLFERKQSTEKKKPNVFSLFRSAYLEVKLREVEKVDTSKIYDRQLENEEGISKLQGDIKGLKIQKLDLAKEMNRGLDELKKIIDSKREMLIESKNIDSKELESKVEKFGDKGIDR